MMALNPMPVPICSTSGVKYDVFLSFRGETRRGFTAHLHRALTSKGIDAYIDYRLDGGDRIDTLFTKISESLVSVVIFSPNYPDSRWCLDELAKIVECKNTMNQRVLPVFYGVEPTHVRKQTGAFGDAFHRLLLRNVEQQYKEQTWRSSLAEIANLSGWDSKEKPEDLIVQEIVGNIEKILRKVSLDDLENGFVGTSRVYKVESLLNINKIGSSENVKYIGIFGESGIGKTAIAEMVFRRNYKAFDGACFIKNVHRKWRAEMNPLAVQRDMVAQLLGDESGYDYYGSSHVSSPAIHTRLGRKRVLIVLDDVRSTGILRILLGSQNFYGPGSRIIVTSTKERVLKHCCGEVYTVDKLNKREALELFQFHALKGSEEPPSAELIELAEKIVDACHGLPLVVKDRAQNLRGKSIKQWKDELAKSEETPRSTFACAKRIACEEVRDLVVDILDSAEAVLEDTEDSAKEAMSNLTKVQEIKDSAKEAMSDLVEEVEEIFDSLENNIDIAKKKTLNFTRGIFDFFS